MSDNFQAVDCDGHIMESLEEMAEYAVPAVRDLCIKGSTFFHTPFPTLDGVHWPNPGKYSGEHGPMGEQEYASKHRPGSGPDWQAFLEKTNVAHSVLFTSDGLTIGLLRSEEYSAALCQAYNDYVADRYYNFDNRLHPMALIPMQKPSEAVKELRRAVKELGLPGAMLPSTGLPLHLGHEYYWPVYEEAAKLGTVLGIHGGSNVGIGLDSYNSMMGSHVIHHPMALLIACISHINAGLFDRLPDLKIAYMEGGCSWTVIALDRMARNAELLDGGWGDNNKTFEHYLASGQILIGCEGEDGSLPYLVERVGAEPFAFSTDYPHEVDFAAVKKMLNETRSISAYTDNDVELILGNNARRFFNLN